MMLFYLLTLSLSAILFTLVAGDDDYTFASGKDIKNRKSRNPLCVVTENNIVRFAKVGKTKRGVAIKYAREKSGEALINAESAILEELNKLSVDKIVNRESKTSCDKIKNKINRSTPFYKQTCSKFYDGKDHDCSYGEQYVPTNCLVTTKLDFDLEHSQMRLKLIKDSNEEEKKKFNTDVMLQTALALHNVHLKGYVHMNVKKINYLMKFKSFADSEIYLSNFSATLKEGDELTKKIIEEKKIDINIMPPEVNQKISLGRLGAKITVNKQIDYFSFGILLAKICFRVKADCNKGNCEELIKEVQDRLSNDKPSECLFKKDHERFGFHHDYYLLNSIEGFLKENPSLRPNLPDFLKFFYRTNSLGTVRNNEIENII
eukprot:GHVR01068950.1.p1 GENE.GHVR01068950.1~~GHVR01068950.1.p1  ORF type:complete len:375 (-),score=30.27 GHVR01068950.1:189-1313(-)